MQLREKAGHSSSELGMSSMTDIIFILLMFFMMTSTLTAPSALALMLPGRSNANNRMTKERLPRVSIFEDGTYTLNGRGSDLVAIEAFLNQRVQQNVNQKVNVIVAPDPNSPVEAIVAILDLTTKLGIDAVLSVDN